VAQATPSNALVGSEWRFTAIDGAAAASDKAKITFDADRLGATVGCNRMNGPWRVEKGRLIAGPLMQTKMFCGGTVGEQEQAAGALLVSAPEVTLKGDRLTLTSHGHSAELARIAAE
jgi:heat shock protein HslJ